MKRLLVAICGLIPLSVPAWAGVESVTVRLEEARCFSWTARIESNLRRLEGVRSVRSDLRASTVTALWEPEVALSLPRLKAAVLRWRGAVRYGGSAVTVVGTLEASAGAGEGSGAQGGGATNHADPGPSGSGAAGGHALPRVPVFRAVGTGQRFRLRAHAGGPDPAVLRSGELWRLSGRAIEGPAGSEEIWLVLERMERADDPVRPSEQGADRKLPES